MIEWARLLRASLIQWRDACSLIALAHASGFASAQGLHRATLHAAPPARVRSRWGRTPVCRPSARQEIHRFGGEQAEAHLRGVIQHHKHVSYVLAGSDERLIRAMIGSRRPFYKLLEPLAFGPMDSDHLARWIEERMGAAGVRADGVGVHIVALAEPRTRDVVQLARSTFDVARRFGRATDAEVEEGFHQIVLSEDAPVRALWESLSLLLLQQNVLRAVAARSSGLTTRLARRQFGLGETGPTTKAAQTLASRDVLVKVGREYRYDSPFMRGWVIANTLADVGVSLAITHLPHVPPIVQ